jgi:hypothetical protein
MFSSAPLPLILVLLAAWHAAKSSCPDRGGPYFGLIWLPVVSAAVLALCLFQGYATGQIFMLLRKRPRPQRSICTAMGVLVCHVALCSPYYIGFATPTDRSRPSPCGDGYESSGIGSSSISFV